MVCCFLHSDHVEKGVGVLKLDPWCKGNAADPTSTATSENFSPASKTMSPSLKMGQSESFARLQLLRYESSICGRMFRLENKSTSGIHERMRRTPRCLICSSHLAGKRYKTTGFHLQLGENTVTRCKLAWAQSEEHNNKKTDQTTRMFKTSNQSHRMKLKAGNLMLFLMRTVKFSAAANRAGLQHKIMYIFKKKDLCIIKHGKTLDSTLIYWYFPSKMSDSLNIFLKS